MTDTKKSGGSSSPIDRQLVSLNWLEANNFGQSISDVKVVESKLDCITVLCCFP